MSRTSRGEWAKRVRRWRDSGLTAKQFAAETGLKASTLTYWAWKLRSEAGGRPGTKPRTARTALAPSRPKNGFVEVVGAAVETRRAGIELVLRDGIQVRVSEGFDESTLTRVVRAVEAAR